MINIELNQVSLCGVHARVCARIAFEHIVLIIILFCPKLISLPTILMIGTGKILFIFVRCFALFVVQNQSKRVSEKAENSLRLIENEHRNREKNMQIKIFFVHFSKSNQFRAL